MSSILDQIIIRKRERLNDAKKTRSQKTLIAETPFISDEHRFIPALNSDRINIIAEIKKRSPSKGIIREDFDHISIARNYAENGATAISVLTEEDHFGGSLNNLADVFKTVDIPLLRKDFIIDEYQLYEAKCAGASAILLIAAVLDGPHLNDLHQAANELGLDVLVEIHNEWEADKVFRYDIQLLGVNNRNLETFETSLDTSFRIAKILPQEITLVSESGIATRSDINNLRDVGFNAFLIGEEFMKSENEGEKLRELLNGDI